MGRAVVHVVRLSIFDWGVRLGPVARMLGLITPTFEFRFKEIRSADVVRGSRPFRGTGVRFRVPDADLIAVFGTNNYLAALNRLSAHDLAQDPRNRRVLIQPYSDYASRQPLEVYSRIALADVQHTYDQVIDHFAV